MKLTKSASSIFHDHFSGTGTAVGCRAARKKLHFVLFVLHIHY